MPRTKQSQRSQAARKRMADQMAADLSEALPPLKKSAELTEHCVHHNGTKDFSQNIGQEIGQKIGQQIGQQIGQEIGQDFSQQISYDFSYCAGLNSGLNSGQNSGLNSGQNSEKKYDQHANMTVKAVSALSPQTSYIRGSFHQEYYRFGWNRGSQCGANSLTAILMCKMKSVLQWTTSDLNAVLIHGDDLYSAMRDAGKINDRTNGFIAVHELPDTHTLKDCQFSINYGETLTGLFGVNKYDGGFQGYAVSFDEAVNRAFQRFDAILVNIKLNICAAVREGSWYAVIDPHSRHSDGRCVADGKSVVVYHHDLHSLMGHFRKLAVSINARYHEFEVTGVNAVKIDRNDQQGKAFCPVMHKTVQAVNESEGEKSQMEADVGCSQSQSDSINSVNKTCAEQKTETASCPTYGNAGDLEFISETASVSLQFSPLTLEQQKSVCLKLKIANVVKEQNPNAMPIEMAEPCQTKDIVGDGNCFFRALAYAVSGTEREHRKLRRSVISHILQNDGMYVQFLRSGYDSVTDYIAKTRMKFVGNWATEMEMQAASDLIGVDIFTYSQDKWFKFSSSNASFNRHDCEQSGIYLKHVNSCHFEVVVCGKSKDGNCASICKSPITDPLFYVASNVSSKSCDDYAKKLEVKEEKQKKAKKRFHEDETYISIINSITKKNKKNERLKGRVNKSVAKSNDSNEQSKDLHCEAVSEVEVDVACSTSLIDSINTDKLCLNEMCAEEKTEMCSLYLAKENIGDVEFISETATISLQSVDKYESNDLNDQSNDLQCEGVSQMELGVACSQSSDVEFISETATVSFQFSPLIVQQQKSICLKLNIVHVVKEQNNPNEMVIEMAEPCETKGIIGDGNCFFRALAYSVSGSQQEHRKVRRAIVSHILQNEGMYVQFLRQRYSSVAEYIATSRMKFVGTWATEMEIQAASDLIGVDIFTYSQEKWLKYTSSNISSNRRSCQHKGIYLKHVNSCHYEVVVCVKTNSNTCACFCKASSEGSMCNVHLKASSDPRKLHKQRLQYGGDHDFKENKKMEAKERYHEDKSYKETLIKCSTKKYKVNKLHQGKVRKYSTDKYRLNDLHCQAVKQYSIQKYHTDTAHNETVKNMSIQKYNEDTEHRESVKKMSILKYNEDTEHRESVKKMSILKYNEDKEHRESVKKMSILKYNEDKEHRQMVINYNLQKYKTDFSFVNNIKMRNAARQYESQLKMKEIDYAIEQFKQKISTGPDMFVQYVIVAALKCR